MTSVEFVLFQEDHLQIKLTQNSISMQVSQYFMYKSVQVNRRHIKNIFFLYIMLYIGF